MTNPSNIQVETTAKFGRKLKKLAKRYRSVKQNLQLLIEQLQTGDRPGDRIVGTSYEVFKVRLQNIDTQKGKSGGYRVIYYVQIETRIILVTLYSKSDQEDIAASEIDQIINEFERQGNE